MHIYGLWEVSICTYLAPRNMCHILSTKMVKPCKYFTPSLHQLKWYLVLVLVAGADINSAGINTVLGHTTAVTANSTVGPMVHHAHAGVTLEYYDSEELESYFIVALT